MHEECRLTGCRGTLERGRCHADDDVPPVERRNYVPKRERAGHRVELVPRFDEAWCRRGVQICPECDHENVRVEPTRVIATDFRPGSIDLIVAWTKRTPGLSIAS